MNVHTEMTALDNIVALNLEVHIWSARKKLTPADFGSADLPPEQLASLGSKRICDPKDLRVFGTLKSRAVAMLDRIGVRFLGGWAIPVDRANEVRDGLEVIKNEFLKAKDEFVIRYDEIIHEWIANNPGWESLIAGSVVSVDYVRHRLSFNWQMFTVAQTAQSQGSGLEEEVTSLGDTLFGEIAKTAKEAWQKSYAGKTEVSRKALSPIRTIHSKLAGLVFVEPRVAPIVELVEAALTKVKGRGPILGTKLLLIQGLLSLLQSPSVLVEHGQKIIEGQSADSMLAGLVGTSSDACPDFVEAELDDVNEDMPPVETQGQQLDSLGLW
ncbi:DUF3150 domain-containing protein [Halodesulfovibrio marinisediminis]|uniref:DUF3150 domain-containing protein n=1 Tax=Halodesulfovibrio marinisediminis DSM 17456 TaxID=1121457 RepID=A0A1N6IFG1_9BACT|nr:DUF3150 domain-containing protein [Halodesulfovibrio marinisediminis]SIO30760.1 Protein of unknown function [Halodesulfovibrio marinisediminis DSM 17456]